MYHHEVIAGLLSIYRWMMRLETVRCWVRVPKTGVVSTNFLQLARRIYLRTCGDETYVQPPNITHCVSEVPYLWSFCGLDLDENCSSHKCLKLFKFMSPKRNNFSDFVNSSVWEKIGTLSDYDVFVVVDQSPGSAITLPDIVRFIWINS